MLDPKLIRRLARIMTSEGVTELSIEDKENGLKVALKRGHQGDQPAQGPVMLMPSHAAPPMGAPAAAAGAPLVADAGGALPPGVVAIESPMVGTFYRAPSPEAEIFADVGTRVDEESVICIVEAMKVMNEIKAELRGEVIEVLVENGDPVEFGQPLFLVKKG